MANSKEGDEPAELTEEVPATANTAKTGNTVIIPQAKPESDNALEKSPELPQKAMRSTLTQFNKQTDLTL